MWCGDFLFHLLEGYLDFVYNNSKAQIIVLGIFGGLKRTFL